MENSSTESNSTFLLNTLDSFINNISLSISKTEHLTTVLEQSSKEIIKPIKKTKQCLLVNIKTIMDQFKTIQCRFQSKASFITDFIKTSNQPLSLSLIKEEYVMNNSVTLQQSNLVNHIEKINKANSILLRIKASPDFAELIQLLKEDDDATVSIASSNMDDEDNDDDEDNNGNNVKYSLLKKKRKASIIGKEKDDVKDIGRNKDNDDGIIKKQKKITKSITAPNKKLFTGKELLQKLKRKFNNSSYVKKLTKTFIKRRLPRKVIYEHSFNYTTTTTPMITTGIDNNNSNNNESISVIDNKIKTIGEKASYKYCKFIINYSSSSISNTNNNNTSTESIIAYICNFFKKNYFIELSNDTSLTFAGKIKENLLNLIDSIFKTNLLHLKFNITSLIVQSYEFFEELAHEFDISKPNIRSHFDDKSLNKLMDNWKMLEIVRNYVSDLQEKGKKD